MKAGAVAALDEILARADGAGDDVHPGLQAHTRHADRLLDTVLIVDDEFLRQHVEHLTVHRERDRPCGVEHPLHVARTHLAALDRHHTVAVEALDVVSGGADDDGTDLAARHQLRFLGRLADRLDGRLDVDDHALAKPLGDRGADADDLGALRGQLGDDRADLVGADVQSNDQGRASRHRVRRLGREYGATPAPASLHGSGRSPRRRRAG